MNTSTQGSSVGDLFKNFFLAALAPFKTHEYLAYAGGRDAESFVISEKYGNRTELSLSEIILSSWPFFMLKAFYEFLYIILGREIFSDFAGVEIAKRVSENQAASIFATLMYVAIYPLVAFLIVKFWFYLIKFFHILYGKGEGEEIKSEQVSNYLLCSNFFYIFPIVGSVFQFISFFILLFAGMRKNLNFTSLQAIVVVFSPLLLIFLLGVFQIIFLLLLVNPFFAYL